MESFGGRPVVEVSINGKGPYDFILDTGANITVVDAALSQELQLSSSGVSTALVGGGAGPQTVNISEMRVGEAQLHDMMAAAMPLGGFFKDQGAPRGVLSAAMLPGYLLTFDYPGKQITLVTGELPRADEQSIFSYPSGEVIPTLPIKVAGIETRIHVDTGAPFGITLPMKFAKQVPLAAEPKEAKPVRTPQGEFPVSTAPVKGEIRIGKYIIVIDDVRFSDVNPGHSAPTGQVGGDVLQHFAVTLDSKNHRIRLAQ